MPDNSWKTGFYAALLKYVQEHGHPNATEVTGFYDSYWSGGCDTCDTCGAIEVDIYFKTADSDRGQTYTYDGSFFSLISNLSEDNE